MRESRPARRVPSGGSVNSKAVLGPDSAHLLVGRKLASRNLVTGFLQGGNFLRRELNDGLLLAKKLQQQPRNVILHRRGQRGAASMACSGSFVTGSVDHKKARE